MPYPQDHAEKSRERILASAYRLFLTKGYDAVSIDEITEDCGLTRGAFYWHFESKAQLYSHAILYAASQSRLAGEKPADLSDRAWVRELLTSYLDKDSAARADWPCPLAFLVTDVAHREPQVRGAYTQAFASMNTHLHDYARSFSKADESTLLAITAMLVGAVAVARTMTDLDLRDRLLAACDQMAVRQLALG